jgi:hypothetical protein
MAGRGAGFCAGFKPAGFQTTGGGFGCGCGRGFRFRNRSVQPVQQSRNDELTELKEQMTRIEQRLAEIQKSS